MRTIAIIGTAGRKTDGPRLTKETFETMIRAAKRVIELENCTHFASGGAAWADHSALFCGLPGTIYLPSKPYDLEIAAYYHNHLSAVLDRDTWAELHTPREGLVLKSGGTFKSRNTLIAHAADTFIAMTFGDKSKVKDGGTADTVRKMQDRGIDGYHLDLNTLKLHHAS